MSSIPLLNKVFKHHWNTGIHKYSVYQKSLNTFKIVGTLLEEWDTGITKFRIVISCIPVGSLPEGLLELRVVRTFFFFLKLD